MLIDTAPTPRKIRLRTPVDQAIDGLTNMQALALGGNFFDAHARVPAMIGPAGWQPGARLALGTGGRNDSWTNPISGFGTSLDKTTATFFQPSYYLSDTSLEAMFHGDDITERMVTTVPKEMLRKGFSIQLGDSKAERDAETAILDALEELDFSALLFETLCWARLFGASALVLGADDGRPPMLPLVPELVRKIDWVQPYDRRYFAVNTYYQSGPKQGKPETYALGNPGMIASPLILVHETRMIVFQGAITSAHVKQSRGGFNISSLQRAYEVIRSFATGYKSVELLLTDGPQAVFKIKGLAQLIGGANKGLFEDRLQTVDMFRSVMRAVVIDGDEEFERPSFNFSGVPDVLEKLGLRLAAAVPMPYSKLMGQGPAGMNATGDGDFRDWYDGIESDRPTKLNFALRRMVQMLCATKEGPTSGAVPPKMTFEYPGLWTLNPKEEAERRLAIAQTDKIYFDMGAATGEEIALSRFTDRGYNGDMITIDRELRQTLIDQEREETLSTPGGLPPADVIDPTIVPVVATVDEVRGALGLPDDPDAEVGAMKVAELAAKTAAATAPGSHATDPAQNAPNGFEPQDPAEVAAAADAADDAVPDAAADKSGTSDETKEPNAAPANPNPASAQGSTKARPKAKPAK